MLAFAKLFFYFLIYSFIGYILEIMFVSFFSKKIVNRGFLCGPICPIYGTGALFIVFFLKKYRHDIVVLFIFGALIATILEYLIGYFLEKIFHNKWWDYSNNRFNINGRICLLNTVLFGISAVLIVKYFQPLLVKILNNFSGKTIVILAIIGILIFITDMISSWLIAFNLRNRLIIVEDLKKQKIQATKEIIEEKVKHLKRYPNRLLKAFPVIFKNYVIEFDIMKMIKYKKTSKSRKKKKK